MNTPTPALNAEETADIAILGRRALHELVTDGSLSAMVERAVADTTHTVVQRALGRHSPFADQLGKDLAAALGVDLSGLGLEGYNQTVLNIVRANLDAHIELAGAAAIKDAMADLLGEKPPETIKLSALAEQFDRWFKENQYGDERPWVALETSNSVLQMSWLVFGAKDTGSRSGLFGTDRREIGQETARMLVDEKDGKICVLRADGIDFSKTIFLGRGLRGFVRTLFQMQAAGTRVEIDTETPSDHLSDWHSDN